MPGTNERKEMIGGTVKYITGLFVVAIMVLVASLASAYTGQYVPGSGINGTPHDLSRNVNGMTYAAVPADPLTRICIFCHAPHNAYRLNGTGIGAGPEVADPAYDYLP